MNKRALEIICHTHSHNCIRTSGAHDWRRNAAAAIMTWSLVMVGLSAWLWFGLFAWYASFGERYATLVDYWFWGLLPELFYLSRLRCSRVVFVPMVGWQYCYIVYGEMSTPIFLTGYGPTLSPDSVTTGS
jgi:hypothetical protein